MLRVLQSLVASRAEVCLFGKVKCSALNLTIHNAVAFVLFLFLTLGSFNVYSQTLIQGVEAQDYNALVDFYNSTNGVNWKDNTGWLNDTVAVSDWHGVSVTSNRVSSIYLQDNNLTGSLPVSIGDLTALQQLRIGYNGVGGSLPSTIGNLQELFNLQLHSNNFTGELPASIGSLSKLRYLYLLGNSFSGSITPVGNLYLIQLRLQSNQFSGPIPAGIGNMKHLQHLYLENNQLTGSIPESLGGLSEVRNIMLGNNQLSGEIPSTLGYLPKLNNLHLYSNQLTGSIPASVGNISTLKSFAVSGNQLSGSVPEEAASLSNLEVFDVSNNKITGLPSTAFASVNLVELDVSSNQLIFEDLLPHKDLAEINFVSVIPVTNDTLIYLSGGNHTIEGIDKLSDTYYKWFKNDTLITEGYTSTYTISNFTAADTGIYHYEMTNAGFPNTVQQSGKIHLKLEVLGDNEEYAALKALYEATNGSVWTDTTNWFNGTSMDSIATWHGITVENGNVTRIDLPNNNLQGPLPEDLGNLKALRYLSIYKNGVESLPESIGKLTSLDTMYVFTNKLSRIPTGIGKLSGIQDLRLHDNQLKSLPIGIGNLTKIANLAVHLNQLENLPESIGKLKNLKILYAYGNNLTSIPESVGSLPELEWIYLRDNKLSSLPASLKDLSNLAYLGVKRNHLPFEAIEQFFSGKDTEILSGSFSYSPQSIKTPIEVATLVGQREVLNARDNAPHNIYQWQKKEGTLWANLEGDTTSTYETALAEGETNAFYRCFITNEWVTTDTLYSPEYHLKVSQSAGTLAENLPDDASTAPAVTGTVNKPADVTTAPPVNYVRTFTPRVEITDPLAISISTSVDTVNIATEYLDGLGRPIQSVAKEASPARRDIIQPVTYDEFGRKVKEYLPYTFSSASPGAYQANALSQQYDFYHAAADNIADTDYPFTENVFEPSPLNRLNAKAAPGESWRRGSGKEVGFSRRPNSLTQDGEIRLWRVEEGTSEENQMPLSTAIYQEGELWVTETADEHGKKVWEYKDKLGQVVLKKVQLVDAPLPSNIEDYLYTYYVYDDFQLLRFVIQPEGLKRIAAASWAVSESIKKDFCFSYRYNGRRRMIVKRVPGAEPVYMVYNRRDLLVLSQDGNQRNKDEWSFTKYDALNRPIASGMLVNRTNATHTSYQESAMTDEVMVESTANSTTSTTGYTNNAFPVMTPSVGDYYLSLSYYDDYDFNEDDIEDAAYQAAGLTPEPVYHPFNQGRQTASKTRIIGTDNWLWTYSFYDDRGRVIQTQTANQLGGQDILTTQYRSAVNDEVVLTKLQHTATRKAGVEIIRSFAYDHAGRLLQVNHQVNAGENVVLAKHQYNELGELITKGLHKGAGDTDFHQQVDYAYNIRGWLTKINDAEAASTEDLFSMNLYYDYGFTKNSFNGNISGAKWKNPLSEDIRAYGYLYDNLNRIKGADYVAGAAGRWTKEKDRYDIGGIQYDYNGNITDLSRNGLIKDDNASQSKEYSTLDVLSYSYSSSGNKLSALSDGGAKREGFKDGDVLAQEYLYDANGNLYEDKNKKISLIEYNHLNLPEKVTFTSGDYLEYDYDAAGNKLSSSVYKAGVLEKQQDYVGELHYVDGLLDFISHEEGRVVVKEGNPEYQYFLKDHLGNTRLTFTSRLDTDEYLATYETDKQEAEANTFQNYNEQDILSYEALNHTPVTGATKVLRLNNYRGDRYGTAKNIAVLPGDTVIAEVYVKYLDLRRSDGLNADAIIAALAGASGYTVSTDAYGTTSITQDGTTNSALLGGPDADAAPTAFLNYYLYDRDRNNYNGGFVQVSAAAAITSPDNLNGGHEMLRIAVPITKAGYIHLEFSHDPDANGLAQDVDTYFDDFSVQHKHGPVIQAEDYYPFGLTHAGSSYTAGERNKYLNQGKELQEELGLNTYNFHARMYDPAIGRTWQPDPLADMYESYSPYSWVMNNPILIIDPTGMASDTTKANTKDDLNDVKPIEISLAPCECELSVEDIVKAVSNIINGTSESEKKQRYQELEGKRSRGEKLTPSEKQDLEDLEDDIFGWNEQGLLRRNMFGDDWPAESLSKAVRRFAGDEPEVYVTESGKVLYRNPTTGVQVVYDVKGDYFRLEDTTKPGKRVFMDMHGTVPNNVVENGKTRGRNQKEYNQITHFRNIDK